MEGAYERTTGLKRALPNWQALSFLMALGLTQLFVFINYKGEGLDKTVAQVYILIPVVVMTYLLAAGQISKRKYSLDNLRLIPMLAFGLFGFMASWGITLLLLGQLQGQEFGKVELSSFWGTVITQVLFVACSEELVFRYLLPSYLISAFDRHWWFIPVMLSQASFAMFHWGVYGGSVFSLIIAFVFGMLMYGAYHVKLWKGGPRLGLGFTIGAHAAYNLVLVGVLAGPSHIITIVGGG